MKIKNVINQEIFTSFGRFRKDETKNLDINKEINQDLIWKYLLERMVYSQFSL